MTIKLIQKRFFKGTREFEIIDDRFKIINSNKRCIKHVVQIGKANLVKANPNAEYGREND